MKKSQLATRYQVTNGKKFRLAEFDPDDTWKLAGKDEAETWLKEGVARLSELQGLLYAQDQWALLLVFQAMDAAGKDGTIKHVMSGVNPQGCQVFSFKVPSAEDLEHDFLWRTSKCLPERGRIGIFNRSYYEECLVTRVHPEYLHAEKIPPKLITKNIWSERFEDISVFERYLSRQGTVILKFFLNVSKKEQRERFLDRLEDPAKNWKFSMGDIAERKLWHRYQAVYQDIVRHTSTPFAPWYVVPADHKWFARVVIGSAIVTALEKLDLHFPRADKDSQREFAQVRKALEAEAQGSKSGKGKADRNGKRKNGKNNNDKE